MTKQEKIKKEGRVLKALPNLHFVVELEDGKEINAHLAGKLKMYRIKVLPGDTVEVEMSPYDEERGRIVWRKKA